MALLSTLAADGRAERLFTPVVIDRSGTTTTRAVGRAVKDESYMAAPSRTPAPSPSAEHPWGSSLQFYHSVLEMPSSKGEVGQHHSSWTEAGAFISLATSMDRGKT